MKYKGFTIISKSQGFDIYASTGISIGWVQNLERAKALVDNMFVANFA